MRILHVLNDCRKIGNGIINVAVDLVCTQSQAGLTVAVASRGGEYEALMKQYRVQHFYLDQRRNPIQIFKAILNFRRIIEQFKPDVVHVHMMTGAVIAYVCKFEGKGYALVSTLHNEYARASILMGLADRLIAVSLPVAESISRRRVPQQKIRVVSNGTIGTPRQPALSETEPMPLKRPAITTVAGMFYRKGIAELIEAFVQIADANPDAHLYLVGDGADRAVFERQAAIAFCADRIHFEGFQPEPQRYLLSTDIFVLASSREPFGLVLSEAREAGCAIVASEVDGTPEALEGGKAGLLVPPKDVSALSMALSSLLNSPTQLECWKQAAQKNLEWLKIDRVHQETLAVYKDATTQRFGSGHQRPDSSSMRLEEE
ncbi:glycosyltransferase family 4 protein [Myxacorys almedinensis]|uniref:Glycosyltransferase n=1 Tax=Myxacorys almedinensis A TaxID=2690445 RepID=A0A8J8CM11_9CYAN|nr:glycosyltransferase family 4 protein [Myxacorys almedinensis]NDJ16742.1 glycosyltransferase [Myxacorys almedinensis A]